MIIITKISNPPNFLLLLFFFGQEISKAMIKKLSESIVISQVFYDLVPVSPVFPILV